MNAIKTVQSIPVLFSILSILFLFAATGCDSPFAGSEEGGTSKTDTVYIVGKDTLYDSLDAERGRKAWNDYTFIQGNLFSTGNIMDLAIEGRGLFVLQNKSQHVYFRRPANFSQDAEGYVNLGNPAIRLQGVKLFTALDPYGDSLTPPLRSVPVELSGLTDVQWPFDDRVPPKPTTEIHVARNLDSDAKGKGSILYSQKFLHHAEASDPLVGLSDAAGTDLGIRIGDVLTLSAASEAMTPAASTVVITADFTLTGLTTAITGFLRSAAVNAGLGTSADLITPADHALWRGAVTVYGNSAAIRNFRITSNRPVSGPQVTKAFAVPDSIPARSTRLTVVTATLRAPAQPEDGLGELYDANGAGLGLESGDVFSISGSLGGKPASNALPLTYAAGPGGSTMRDVLKRIQDNFKLPDRDGTADNNPSVTLNPAGSDDNIPDGSIVIRGRPESASAIQETVIRSTDFNIATPSPTFFNTNMNMTTLREASDDRKAESAITVFDATGKEHTVTLTFTPTQTPNQWLWGANMGGPETIRLGSRGRLTFGQDGSVAEFSFEGGATRLEVDPGGDAEIIRIALKAGGPGDFTGLTQFRGESTAAFLLQNGFPAGKLKQISIGEDGIISGYYTNGQSKRLYQIPLADFPNKRGLKRVGGNSFVETPESGAPAVSTGLAEATGRIAPGAIEYATDAERTSLCEIHPECKTTLPDQ